MEETRWNLLGDGVWGVSDSPSLPLQNLTIFMQSVILTRSACSRKLNRSQAEAGKNSALGKYLFVILEYLSDNCFIFRRFESWNPATDVQPGTLEYYKKQVYKHGTRCWNGPERNTVVGPFDLTSITLSLDTATC